MKISTLALSYVIWSNMLGYTKADRRDPKVRQAFNNFIDRGATFN